MLNLLRLGIIGAMMTKDEAKQTIAKLVAKYLSLSPSEIKSFNEANTKQGFIEPLFRALGWNVDDTNEVTLEEKASNGRVDYAFKLNGVSQFYLEAKSLKADLTNADYIKQAITYAYNKGVTWAVLTDFRELRLFNAQSGKGWLSLNYAEYVSGFEKLWLFSKESLATGLLEKEAAQNGALPTPLPVETRLFKQLRQWREELFSQLKLHNEKLTFTQIDEIIQRLFNRLIFIRTAEDRHIENNVLRAMVNQWKSAGRPPELYDELKKIFREFDGYYDSDLFAIHLTDHVFVEGTTIEHIIDGLYEVPGGMASYDFSIIDADVLGAVYEQYLGYVAQIVKERAKTAQGQLALGIQTESINLVEKKERRKEQGIYYTPKFVTDYIVKETVGRFIAEHSPTEIRNIKILDPACGSGSFLIRAFDELLKYYASQKISQSEKDIDAADRISFLTNNIFGVDLDIQAVEIARLNLLLRSLARRDILPSLKENIRQGNSLISGTEEELKKYFGDSWRDKKPFNWAEEFKDIMANGGFDVVIGNPPYVRIQTLPRDEADYYRALYESAFGSFDIYVLFLEEAIRLLKPSGRLGFITSGKFLKADYGKYIQKMIRNKCTVESIIDLSAQKVFGEATTYPTIIILKKDKSQAKIHYVLVPAEVNLTKSQQLSELAGVESEQDAITAGAWPPVSENNLVMRRLRQGTLPLSEVTDRIFQGLKTSADKVFVLSRAREEGHNVVAFSDSLNKQVHLELQLVKPLIKTGQMDRYQIQQSDKIILFPYLEGKLVPSEVLEAQYPFIWKYLLENRKLLSNRERGAFAGEEWYQYGRNQAIQMVSLPKIVTPDFAPSARFSLDESGVYFFSGGTAGGYGIIPSKNTNTLFLLGLLNSRLLDWFLHGI